MKTAFKFAAVALLMGSATTLFAQEKEEEKPVYQITETVNVKHTPVDNQGSSGTCWCFAGIGFVEAEIQRLYGKEFNLSEMFVVRKAWAEKVAKFVRMHGNSTLWEGGEVCDVLYMIRAPRIDQVMDIYRRVNLIANGAAMMTETTCTITFIKGCSNLLNNSVVGKRYYENLKAIGVPEYTKEELEYADKMNHTVGNTGPGETEVAMAKKYAHKLPEDEAKALLASFEKPMSDVVMPFVTSDVASAGSTDVSDVSMVCPCTYFYTACWSQGTPGHSWQIVAQGKGSIAHKGMLYGAEVLALTAIDFMEDPALVEAAKAEYKDAMGGKPYECPIPKDVKAPVPPRA